MGSGRGTVVAVLAGAGLGALVLLWAAGSDTPLLSFPDSTVDPPGPEDEAPVSAPPQPRPTGAEQEPQPDRRPGLPWDVLLALLVTLVVLGLLVRVILRLLGDRGQEPQEEQDGLEELEALVAATSAQQRARAAAEEDPRNAVVACWVALEDAAASSGLPRGPAETSMEFTSRVLTRWQVRQEPLTELARLYREARFSRHPVTEEQRERALATLALIHEDLQVAR
ncbi:DUF4129 domain-containing protein [Ornithinicoccus halotolerans]|uniref:DUF4129 domain-containing protein n=1 Tax=Ornithinicoccus halotolerans TaxID=1748220 RepID=UPI0012982190|nr:DUF4129 domain-containing protein [Ornithinicoccus halotolerans]